MKKSYLKEWLSNFPNLTFLLSSEDKSVLDTIDPRQYEYFNLTRDEEVVRIINEHKPQAAKWERLFPGLQNISSEDRAILDHIVPTDYLDGITEEDIRRIIEYRKSEYKKSNEDLEEHRARQYYESHKKEIAREEKSRSRLVNIVKGTTIAGIALATAGIVAPSFTHLCIGVSTITAPLLLSALFLQKLDRRSIIPRPVKPTKDRLDILTVAFIILYYIGLIGLGITLGTLFVWDLVGWDTAETVLLTGLTTIGASVILFLLIAIAIPSKD